MIVYRNLCFHSVIVPTSEADRSKGRDSGVRSQLTNRYDMKVRFKDLPSVYKVLFGDDCARKDWLLVMY